MEHELLDNDSETGDHAGGGMGHGKHSSLMPRAESGLGRTRQARLGSGANEGLALRPQLNSIGSSTKDEHEA